MQLEQAKKWNKTGMQIARGYADKLDDITNDCAYSKYFYILLLFDGDNGTGAIPLPHLKYAMDRLAKRRVSISSQSPLKQLLGDFLSYCTIMFSNESTLKEARDTLISNRLLPSAVDVLGTKVGAAFVAGRYDEIVGKRMGKSWDEGLNSFQKVNWRVMALGEWFAEQRENASNAVALIGTLLGVGFFILTVIFALVNEGVFAAVIAAVILGVIYYYLGMITLGLLIIITKITFTLLRYVFYNIYTLIVTIIFFILIYI